jgi:hypothetical protein
MMKVASILYLLIFILAYIHKAVGGENWTSIRFLGGFIDPPGIDAERLHGALSFAAYVKLEDLHAHTQDCIMCVAKFFSLTFWCFSLEPIFSWIPHWTMFLDLITQTRYMSRWADCTGIRQWKALSLLHLPYVVVNAIVALNHFHRDGISGLKLLHPLFVLVGSLTTLLGTTRVVSAGSDNSKCLLDDAAESKAGAAYPDWDPRFTAKSMILAVFLSYASVYSSQGVILVGF